MNTNNNYDILVIGAGHAGCEAALATSRMGLATAVFTINLDTIGQMSCNPAIYNYRGSTSIIPNVISYS